MPRKKKIDEMTEEELIRLVVGCVKRLRRIALHPLALQETANDPMPGGLLRHLMQVQMEVTMNGETPETITLDIPDEVQFESLAARARPFTMESDRLFWEDLLRALERLLETSDDRLLKDSLAELHEEWREAAGRNGRMRTFWIHLPESDVRLTDVELAYAWLYQDLAHGDESPAGGVGIHQRFEAAVGVFSHLAVVCIETLHFVNHLVEIGLLALPVGTFSSPVVVTSDGLMMKVTSLSEVDLDVNLEEAMKYDGPMPKTTRPVSEIAKELTQEGYWRDAEPAVKKT